MRISAPRVFARKVSSDGTFQYVHYAHPSPHAATYNPHMHNGKEIFVLLKGTIDFIIENNVYSLSPNDILVIDETELHTFRPVRSSPYERIVINLQPSFFTKNNIETYQNVFANRPTGQGNLFRGHTEENALILSRLVQLERYIKENPDCEKVLEAVLIEILYLLNTAGAAEESNVRQDKTVAEILQYINDNLTESLSLDKIADTFYLSKNHLCRIFKKNTGFTVKDYIASKRIQMVQSLCREGVHISEAAARAGFGNYSNFYRIYVNKTGFSPRETLKNL